MRKITGFAVALCLALGPLAARAQQADDSFIAGHLTPVAPQNVAAPCPQRSFVAARAERLLYWARRRRRRPGRAQRPWAPVQHLPAAAWERPGRHVPLRWSPGKAGLERLLGERQPSGLINSSLTARWGRHGMMAGLRVVSNFIVF